MITLAPDVDGIPAWAQCQTDDCNCTKLATYSVIQPWGAQLFCDKHKFKNAEKLPKNWHLIKALIWSTPVLKNPPKVVSDDISQP